MPSTPPDNAARFALLTVGVEVLLAAGLGSVLPWTAAGLDAGVGAELSSACFVAAGEAAVDKVGEAAALSTAADSSTLAFNRLNIAQGEGGESGGGGGSGEGEGRQHSWCPCPQELES